MLRVEKRVIHRLHRFAQMIFSVGNLKIEGRSWEVEKRNE